MKRELNLRGRMLLVALALLIVSTVSAQQAGEWYKKNLESGSFGIELEKAQEFLKGKEVKKNPIVAFIGTGCDIEHEDLEHSIWINPKEVENGKDSDKNGYIDDLHGWNFISSPDGEFLEALMQEGDREWLRLRDKYADIVFDGTNYYKYIDEKRVQIAPPKDMKEYSYFRELANSRESQLASKYNGALFTHIIKEHVAKWDDELKEHFPGRSRKEISIEDYVGAIKLGELADDSLAVISMMLTNVYASAIGNFVQDVSWDNIYQYQMFEAIDFTYDSFIKDYEKIVNNDRQKIVGDDPLNIKDRSYGSNMLLTPVSMTGTMLSGIVTSIAPEAKLMHLVISAGNGEPYLKDMALAIRYAVDNGADVIMLPQQNSLYPEEQRVWVEKELLRAQKKGALVVVPTWENAVDMDEHEYFPNRNMSSKRPLFNIMTVANSDEKGMPVHLAAYGEKSLDLFAPGVNIYATAPGDLYRTGTSASFGPAVTVGVAALIKSYFPKLSGKEVRELIINNVTDMGDKEIEKGIRVEDRYSQDLFLFEQLCTSAGIINANNAIRAAFSTK